MIVYLLRHGEAEDIRPGGARSDAERRLTKDGAERLRRAAPVWCQCVGQVDRVYVSTLIRARQTGEIFAEAVQHRGELLVSDWLVPEADPDVAAKMAVADAVAGNDCIAFVGHEPHLGELLARLLLGRGSIPFKKGMLVGVELLGTTATSGRLVCCLTTKLASRIDVD